MKRTLTYLLLLNILCLLGTQQTFSQEKQKIPLRDSTDGAIDLSYFLSTTAGFLPFVMPITEPAVGYGAAAGPLFIHRNMEALKRGEPSPPSMTMLAGMYTENGTWGVVGAHSGIWGKDRIRYLGVLFYGSANLTYYPSLFPNRSVDFNIGASGLIQQIAFRPFKPKVFIGLRYQFTSTKVSMDFFPNNETIQPWEMVDRLGTAGPVLFTDYRDNSFTPNKGVLAKIFYGYSDTWLGSNVSYSINQAHAVWFANPASWLVTGLRLDFQSSWGDIPFFAKPFVNLRGIPVMRYQDFLTLTLETEERIDLTPRWSLTAFGGVAKAFNTKSSFSDFDWVYNIGGGFRYKIARLLGIYSGLDVGIGPDGSWGFYVVMGHVWNRT